MLSILDLGENIIAYRSEGKLQRDDIIRVFAEIDRRLETPGPVRVYGEIASLDGISLEALWQDLRLSVARWNAVPRIQKAALVTDVDWLRRAAIWEDRLFRGIEIRSFPLAEREEAEAWVRA